MEDRKSDLTLAAFSDSWMAYSSCSSVLHPRVDLGRQMVVQVFNLVLVVRQVLEQVWVFKAQAGLLDQRCIEPPGGGNQE